MKKILTIALALGFGVAASAQSNDQIQNKKGKDLMPVKGEYAIGLGTTLGTLVVFRVDCEQLYGFQWAGQRVFARRNAFGECVGGND